MCETQASLRSWAMGLTWRPSLFCLCLSPFLSPTARRYCFQAGTFRRGKASRLSCEVGDVLNRVFVLIQTHIYSKELAHVSVEGKSQFCRATQQARPKKQRSPGAVETQNPPLLGFSCPHPKAFN